MARRSRFPWLLVGAAAAAAGTVIYYRRKAAAPAAPRAQAPAPAAAPSASFSQAQQIGDQGIVDSAFEQLQASAAPAVAETLPLITQIGEAPEARAIASTLSALPSSPSFGF